MGAKYKILGVIGVVLVIIGMSAYFLRDYSFAVLEPKGTIAAQQRDLMYFAVALSLLVVIPVFTLTILFAYKYRASNKKAEYKPDWDSNRKLETVWWGIPIALIVVLSIVTWQSTHALDPYRALASDIKPVRVQVVALQWRWLFIYPDYDIATINYLQIPEQTPINFEITADAPMNSFWIPELGGQIYAMSGMSTKLHLMADTVGSYTGYSANISGEGFANMRFITESTSQSSFDDWVAGVRTGGTKLDAKRYAELATPSNDTSTQTYSDVAGGLYTGIIMKYMQPHNELHKQDIHGGDE